MANEAALTPKQRRHLALLTQVRRVDKRAGTLQQVSDWYGWLRLGLFLAGGLASVALCSLLGNWGGWASALVWLILFGGVVTLHRQIDESLHQHQAWARHKRIQMARMVLDWETIPPPAPETEAAPTHPFEIDLDISGERSLHLLIDVATSREGSERLRGWLLTTEPDGAQVQRRQALVQELAALTVFRSKLHLYGALLTEGDTRWNAERLLDWLGERAAPNALRWPFLILGTLALLNTILFVLAWFAWLPPLWVGTFVLYIGLTMIFSQRAGAVFGEAQRLEAELNKIGAILDHLEGFRYDRVPHLKALCAPLQIGEQRPSQQLRRITLVVIAAGLQENPFLGVAINAVLPWNIFFAHLLNHRKAEIVELLPQWLDIWFELEALSSLANFAYLNPSYHFPPVDHLTAPRQPPVFQATELGHPLIPDQHKVCNDFRIDQVGEVVIITGSNMAGKSSFLRTLGVNLCLLYAGGPVNADTFDTGIFRLFTCIRVSDSVIDGISYFYAEVKRLRALLDALNRVEAPPLFFLIDEIFKGTNNRERLIGSRAYIQALVGQHGIGLITTHDLELVKIAEETTGVSNYHFREDVQDGQMIFDYTLRPGPSPTTNALKIMQMEGLPVPRDSL